MAQLRPKIVKLAKIIGGVTGITTKIDENAPEYYCMAGILSDDEADIAIAAGLRKERTAGYLAKKVGKTVQEVQPLLDNLVYYGIFRRSMDKALGEDVYYMQIFAPGILEMMVNQKELLETHPEVGRAFDEYTRNLAASMGAMIPDGYGLMRVIPVESALEGIEGVSDYERISHYLDKYDRFSVSPCSCRASRSSLGDGCGHLEEDMCVQMGRGAEHYIRTGRAREITREQALEIIQRAEENGLMHDMVNIEEPGESAAICNCCACACFGLRVGLMFGARDAIRSNYVAEVDEAKCVACGQCVETCPGNALKLGQKLCSTEDLTPQPDYVKLSETIHPKRSWNPDYREDHEDVMPTGTAPCKTACPAHVPVQGYLKLAAQGRYTDALELIKKENPFPAVCGRICNKRCETECTRGAVDEAVAIDEVKRFIADHDLHEATRFVPKLCNQIGRPYTEKIAVIGAGPAGMSCAYYLANKGYPVTVFDRNPVPGGMLTLGIPNFRLEKDVLNAEIDILREMGVEFRCGVEVGRDITIGQLRAQGYKGFYLAIDLAKKVGSDLILGTDPDSDRVGVMVRGADGEYHTITGNQMGVLLLDYIITAHIRKGTLPENAAALSTIVTSKMVRRICDVNNIHFEETFTGFKFMAEKLAEYQRDGSYQYLLAFEESYGYMMGDYVRDKDAVTACVMITEMAAYYFEQGMTLAQALDALYEKYGFYGERTLNLVMPGLDGLEKMRALMAQLRREPLQEIAGTKVVRMRDYQDGSVYVMGLGRMDKTPISGSNVLYFELDDGCAFIVRPSGTEPKIKVYILGVGATRPECDERVQRYAQFAETLRG